MPGPSSSPEQPGGPPSVGLIGAARDREGLARTFSSRGFSVLAFEVDRGGVPDARAASSPRAAAGLARLGEPDALVVCTPVALTPARGADTSALAAAARTVAGHLRRGQLVLLAVAAPPGTTRRLLLPLLAASGLTPGRDFLLACGPPSPGAGGRRVVGGFDEAGAEAAMALLARAGVPATRVSSPEAAEVCGAVTPVLAAVRAAAVNELRLACDRMGVNAWEVLAASGGPAPASLTDAYSPEPPLLAWGARQWGSSFGLLEAATRINAAIPGYLISKVADALNGAGKAVRGSRVAILGTTCKKDVNDPRESPGFGLLDLLIKKGAVVTYNDPHVASLPRVSDWPHSEPMQSQALTPEYLGAQDCVLIATDHSAYDYPFILTHSKLVIDTCNTTRAVIVGREKSVRC